MSTIIDSLPDALAERDRARNTAAALEAQLAQVQELAEGWRYDGRFGYGPGLCGEGPDLQGAVLDECAVAILAILDPDGGAE